MPSQTKPVWTFQEAVKITAERSAAGLWLTLEDAHGRQTILLSMDEARLLLGTVDHEPAHKKELCVSGDSRPFANVAYLRAAE